MSVLIVYYVLSDEINRKIDRLRREIDQSKEQRSDLEQQVYRLREKKVDSMYRVMKSTDWPWEWDLLLAVAGVPGASQQERPVCGTKVIASSKK